MNATEWFDQFSGLRPETAELWNTKGQWCPRHWAPCPQFGANGFGASVELVQTFINALSEPATDPEALNRLMDEAGYLCCKLGDERMYELWGHWPPEDD
jgi:hypothetical protein